jgi:cation diffusion facilitator CzcD-associated flavoprotein CzcO
MADPDLDVLIIGAGVSGIGAACHLMRECPTKTFAIVERRKEIGGTWDLFRYPGIRSDSDMFTFGFDFRPWHDTKVLADGTSIREYVRDTAADHGVLSRIRFGQRVNVASWSSVRQAWTVSMVDESTGAVTDLTARFLMVATGYYDYDNGHRPAFPGEERFTGPIVHPQHWPADLDYAGKRVVVIGSGATAVTLVPAMAEQAAHVTMLQRSPTYVLALPAKDTISAVLRRFLPTSAVYQLGRIRNVLLQGALWRLSKSYPKAVRNLIVKGAEKQLRGKAELRHFMPRYDPWDQRLCVVPDGDLFQTIRDGKVSVVTDEVEAFTETGVRLRSGAGLEADVIISATGLNLKMLGGVRLEVDGEPVPVNTLLTYKAVMLENVPNAALVFGYVNASWTLKADLAARYVCRLLNYLDAQGYTEVVARARPEDRGAESILNALNSGYVRRGNDKLPRQGIRGPWRVTNNYLRDFGALRFGVIDDGILRFRGPHARLSEERPSAADLGHR